MTGWNFWEVRMRRCGPVVIGSFIVPVALLVVVSAAIASPQAGNRVVGRFVVEGTSEPVPDAQLFLMTKIDMGPGSFVPPPLRTTSNAEGKFAFENVIPGSCRLQATKYGFTWPPGPTTFVSIELGSAPLSEVTVVLQRSIEFSVSGRVLDPTGRPLANTMVRVFDRRWTAEADVPATIPTSIPPAKTDARGEYRVGPMAAGQHLIVAIHIEQPPGPPGRQQAPMSPILAPTFYPSTTDIAKAATVSSSSGGELRGFDIKMISTPAFVASGTVVGSDGQPVARAAATLIVWSTVVPARTLTAVIDAPSQAADRWIASTLLGGDGSFSLSNVPPGSYRLFASSPPVPGSPLRQGMMTMDVAARISGIKLILGELK
jgi:hypothetical protein